jgi:hypothetical protein
MQPPRGSGKACGMWHVVARVLKHGEMCNFGKHKGKTYGEIMLCDLSYVKWAAKVDSAAGPLVPFQQFAKTVFSECDPPDNWPRCSPYVYHREDLVQPPSAHAARRKYGDMVQLPVTKRAKMADGLWYLPGALGARLPGMPCLGHGYHRKGGASEGLPLLHDPPAASGMVGYHISSGCDPLRRGHRARTSAAFANERPAESLHWLLWWRSHPNDLYGQQYEFVEYFNEIGFIGRIWEKGPPAPFSVCGSATTSVRDGLVVFPEALRQ